MRNLFFGQGMITVAAAAAFCLAPMSMMAQQAARAASEAKTAATPTKPAPRTADGHPDLNGIWSGSGFKFSVQKSEGSINVSGGAIVAFGSPAALQSGVQHRPLTGNVPSYKPELEAKVNYLDDNENKVDQIGRAHV